MLGKSILNKKLSFGFVFSTLSIGVEGLAGLVILPLLLGFLSEAIVGLWLFFLSFVGFISLGQAGLGPVVTKLAAAKKITPNLHSNLWGNVTFVYLYSSLIVVIICTIIYFSYISGVLKEENFVYDVYSVDFADQGAALHGQILLFQSDFVASAVRQLAVSPFPPFP